MVLQANKIKFLLILLLPLFFAIAVIVLSHFHLYNCIWKTITGHACPGCGMTRAFYSLLHGNFKAAYEYNHLIIIVVPIFVYLWIKLLMKNTPYK